MELSQSQIDNLFEFTENNGVHYYDVQVELVDHLAAKIEADMAGDGTLTFPEALNRAFNSFGLNGFEEVLHEKKKAVSAQRRKVILQEVKQWFTFQRLTYILAVGLTTYFLWTVFGPLVRMWIIWISSFLLFIYQLKRVFDRKITKRILLFDENGFSLLFFIVTVLLLFSGPCTILSSWHVGIMANVVLGLFVLQVITFNLDRRLLMQAQALYPEAIALKGSDENWQKQKRWYDVTLSLDEQTLGETLPADPWTEPIEKQQEVEPFRFQPKSSSKLLLLFLLAIMICYLLSYANIFPFPFTGTPQAFLICFVVTAGIVTWAYKQFLVREKTAIAAYVEANFPAGINAFQMAYFLHGPGRAIQTAIVDLVNKGDVEIKDSKTIVVTKQGQLLTGENPLYDLLSQEKEGSEVDLENIISACYAAEGFDHQQLKEMQKSLNVFSFEETLPHLFILITFLYLTIGGSWREFAWLWVSLPFISFGLFFGRRDTSGRKKMIPENVKRKYIAETDVQNSEEVDPVKRFAVQTKPSVIAFPQPALLNSILVEVHKSTAVGCGCTGDGVSVENFEGAFGSRGYGGMEKVTDER